MRRQALIVAAAAVLAAPAVRAQPLMGAGPGAGAAGGMPDLSRVVGRPLPDPGMPPGTVSVRVARKMPVNAVAGVEVSAIIKNAGGDLRKRALTTDDSGRVLFEGIQAGGEFKAEVNVDGEHLQTETFTMPSQGGLRTMLISGLAGGAGGGGEDADGEQAAGAPAAEGNPRGFSLGATAGNAVPDPALPVGTLEIRLHDEKDAPIANHPIVLGMVNKQGGVDVRRAASDAAGLARFTGLPIGKETGFAAVIDWHGVRLNTAPFAMPDGSGARADIRALARTADPSVVTIGDGGRIVLQMQEDSLNILELLPIENTSDQMFDPGPGAFEIPLPTGFLGAQGQENARKVEVRQNHGIAVHGAVVPKKFLLASPDAQREQEVVFGFVLPYHGDSREFVQPAPNGIGQLTLIIDQKIEHLSASGPGVGQRREQVFGGHKYWAIPIAGAPRGGAITFTLTGLPSNGFGGQLAAGIISLALVLCAVAFARRPQSGAGGPRRSMLDDRSQLVDRREALYAELVSMERTARAAGTPLPTEQRRQLVGRLEQIYQDIAALDEPRAA